jgi:hypothetical protein
VAEKASSAKVVFQKSAIIVGRIARGRFVFLLVSVLGVVPRRDMRDAAWTIRIPNPVHLKFHEFRKITIRDGFDVIVRSRCDVRRSAGDLLIYTGVLILFGSRIAGLRLDRDGFRKKSLPSLILLGFLHDIGGGPFCADGDGLLDCASELVLTCTVARINQAQEIAAGCLGGCSILGCRLCWNGRSARDCEEQSRNRES